MKRLLTFIIVLSAGAAAFGETQDPVEQNRLGVESAKQGQYTDSLTHFNKSIAQYDRESAKSIHNLGWLYESKGDAENALIYYEEALRRNPDQVHTLERAGFLHYRNLSFEKAILYGEKVMKLDPMNQEVIKWLPDAYAQMFKLKGHEISKNAAQAEQQKIIDQVKEQKKEEKKQRRYILATFDTTLRFTYDAGKKNLGYTMTDAYLFKAPYMINIDFTPTDAWELKAQAGVPYWGSLTPDVTWMSEKIEGYFYQKNYFIGTGLMLNHYGGSSIFGAQKTLWDYKLGIIVGKYQERSRLDIILYPRMFPADNGAEGKQTMDVDTVEVSYSYLLSEDYRLYGKGRMADFYFFDNQADRSSYYGLYDFTFGFGLYDKPAASYLFRFEFTERMYLKNENNPHPHSSMNGQGMFGLDGYHWFRGDPMSGIDCFATVLSAYAQEQILSHLFVYQKASLEIVPPSRKKNDFCITLGVGGTY